MPTTAALDHAIRMFASSHPGAPSYLVDALEEAMRLIADLQARVALLESDGSQALAGVWELDDSTDEERAKWTCGTARDRPYFGHPSLHRRLLAWNCVSQGR